MEYTIECPKCQTENPSVNRKCEECGALFSFYTGYWQFKYPLTGTTILALISFGMTWLGFFLWPILGAILGGITSMLALFNWGRWYRPVYFLGNQPAPTVSRPERDVDLSIQMLGVAFLIVGIIFVGLLVTGH